LATDKSHRRLCREFAPRILLPNISEVLMHIEGTQRAAIALGNWFKGK
jgi:hypothetical protein